ncbi:MAG: hypothetical protein ACYC2H_03495 [Thermoplasmatota archaeon]
MNNRLNTKSLSLLAAAALLGIPLVAAALDDGASNGANKTSAAGSTIEFLGPALEQTVLATTIKTSAPQDLIFSVTLECALWTTVATIGNDVSEARATITVKVLFDGVAVPISSDDADGSVVFCDRLHRQTTTDFDDEDARIEQYLATRSANGFNWLLPDVGSGVHTVQVVADLVTAVDGSGALAEAAIGHRTLIVEPTHLSQGATIDSGL